MNPARRLPFNAPVPPAVMHDRALVRRYLCQSALRWGGAYWLLISLTVLVPFGIAAGGRLVPLLISSMFWVRWGWPALT